MKIAGKLVGDTEQVSGKTKLLVVLYATSVTEYQKIFYQKIICHGDFLFCHENKRF